MERTHAGEVNEEKGRIYTKEVHGGLSPIGGTPCWSRKESEEEGVAETTCEEMATIPIPCPPALPGGQR